MRPRGRSFWLDEAFAHDRGVAAPLWGDTKVDVCIVGGGYTGLWTALRLKELDRALSVAAVEADVCGGGASGRNGGFVLSWWAKFATLVSMLGADEALRLARASEQAVTDIGEFCRRHDVDAHYRHDGWLWTATNAAQRGAWTSTIAAARAHGADPFRELPDEEVARRAGSAAHLAGVFEAGAATVQPARLARGLRRVALERGVHVFEHSPVLALERSRPLRARTPLGAVVADRVVVAIDAWSALLPELERAFFVVSSDIVVTEPAPEALEKIGWTSGMSISDSRSLVNYYRTTRDGRVAFGRGGGRLAYGGDIGRAYDGVSGRAADVEGQFRRLYPEFEGVAVAQSWQGPVGRTPSGLPCFGHLPGRPDITYGFGYSGNGVGPSWVGGRILASLALGVVDEWSTNGLTRGPASLFPPEPVRYFAGRVVRAAVARKEAAEDAGRAPAAVDVRLAALGPPGLVPVRT